MVLCVDRISLESILLNDYSSIKKIKKLFVSLLVSLFCLFVCLLILIGLDLFVNAFEEENWAKKKKKKKKREGW